MNAAAIRSSGIYHTTPTTTTTTPVMKSNSPTNSCAVESVFFDEPVAQKIIVQELTTPETLKLDLLIQTKTLAEKMKAFMTLMDANQLSLAEQQQVYESIKDDYEKLLKTLEQKKRSNDFCDLDVDGDLNDELETMKQLLKEIVKRITDNLLGKTNQSFDHGRQNGSTKNDCDTSQLSTRSSLCNHNELMNQYEKLLNAVNTEPTTQKKPVPTKPSRQSSHSDISEHVVVTSPNKPTKPYVYVSGNSDDEQQVSSVNQFETPSYNVDHIPSQLNRRHRQIDQEQTHIHGLATTTTTKKKKDQQSYDNLDNSMTKNKRKSKKSKNHYEAEKELSPSTLSVPTVATRHSSSSLRTRTSDYDSGIGTTNTTKLSRDSRLNTSTMDESHCQSLDDDRRRHTDEDQESMSTVSSTSSSTSLSTSSLYNKYTKRFHSTSTLKSRQRPNVHSDVYQSDTDTHLTGSFDPIPPPPLFSSTSIKKSRHSKRASSLNSFRRSQSSENFDRTQISSKDLDLYSPMSRKYRSGFIHSKKTNEPMYKSSFYINQPHPTHQRTVKTTSTQQQQKNDLYFDPQTGVIYRYIPNKTQPPTTTTNYYQQTPTSTVKDTYQCRECGSVTNYHHRHHIHDRIRRNLTDIDDLGYESGQKRVHRQYIQPLTASDSEHEDNHNYLDLSKLNEACERAKKVQHRSQNLSRHISRQLRLVLTTM